MTIKINKQKNKKKQQLYKEYYLNWGTKLEDRQSLISKAAIAKN